MSKIYTDRNLYQTVNQTLIFESYFNLIRDYNIVDYFLKCLKYRLGGFNKFNKYEFDFYKLNTYENYFKDLQYSILYNPIITFYIENNEENIKDYMKLNDIFNDINFKNEKGEIKKIAKKNPYNFFDFIFDRFIVFNMSKNLKEYVINEKNWIKENIKSFFENENISKLINEILNKEYNFNEEEINIFSICIKFYFLFENKLNSYLKQINENLLNNLYDEFNQESKENIKNNDFIAKGMILFILNSLNLINNFSIKADLKIIFEIQKQIIIQIQIKMFQLWKNDNFMTLIYSFLFDFRKNKNFIISQELNDMLMKNIRNFLKNINYDSLKNMESEFNQNYYKIVPSENKKNKINEISNDYEIYTEKNNNNILPLNSEDNWFNLYKQNNDLFKIVNIIFKYIIPFLFQLYKLFNTKIKKNVAETKAIKEFLNKENLQNLFNNFKKGLDKLKPEIDIKYDENTKLYDFLNIDNNNLFNIIENLSIKYNEILTKIGEKLQENNKILKSKKYFDIQSENILPFLNFKNSTNNDEENELNLEKNIIDNYNNYLIINNQNTDFSFKLNKYIYFDLEEFENNLLSIFSNKFLIDISKESNPLFIFDTLIGKKNVINKFKSKYKNKEEIENNNKEEIIKFIKQKNNEEIIDCFKQYYNLLHFLTNEKEKMKMKDIMRNISNAFIKNKDFLKIITDLLKIENLLPLLEIMEENCYQYLEDAIDNKFHNNDDKENIKKEKEKLNNLDEKIREKFILALRRFILRMIYDNEEVEPDDDIIDLIKEKDYWNDEDINIEFLNKMNIKAKNIIAFYNSLQKKQDKRKNNSY